jgi:hypothetical protein
MASQGTINSTMKTKLALISCILSVATAQPFAYSANPAASKSDASKGTKNAASNLVLDDIQDVAYTLQRIRQQAINIDVEATRKEVTGYDLDIRSLSEMPKTPLEKQSTYLPLRKAWLVFFIGTMEPLVQILGEELKSLDDLTEKSNIAKQTLPEWLGLVNDWKATIGKLNKQLDVCARLVDDSTPDNVEVAQAARAIDSQIASLDQILHKASRFLQDKLPQK